MTMAEESASTLRSGATSSTATRVRVASAAAVPVHCAAAQNACDRAPAAHRQAAGRRHAASHAQRAAATVEAAADEHGGHELKPRERDAAARAQAREAAAQAPDRGSRERG